MIGLVNYGSGNYKSLSNVLDFLNVKHQKISSPEDFTKVSHIILPGVGSYSGLIEQLKKKKLFDELNYNIRDKKKPFLGICVGMQILSEEGEENIITKGLNLVKGKTIKIPTKKLRLPNIGWHNINLKKKNILFKDIEENELFFYFFHSFFLKVENHEIVTSTIFFEHEVTASIQSDNIFAVQFHPEKSQVAGCKLLNNFINL